MSIIEGPLAGEHTHKEDICYLLNEYRVNFRFVHLF